MRSGVPSRTALGAALHRAAHQLYDHPQVFTDPVATKILAGISDVRAIDGRGSRTLRAFLAARSRYAEDQLEGFVAAGVTQFVVLGAGLDTFAYRNRYSPTLTMFEVDHPNTQAWKRQVLLAAGIPIPKSLTFLPVDFEKQTLGDSLQQVPAFNPTRKTFFSWLGVTPYLLPGALESTLRSIASLQAGCGVVFDYAMPPCSLNSRDRIALKMLSLRVAAAGEPFRLSLQPQLLASRLRQLGFRHIEDLGRPELNTLYFAGRSDGLSIQSGVGRIVCARNDL